MCAPSLNINQKLHFNWALTKQNTYIKTFDFSKVQKIFDNPSQAERIATTLSLLNNETDEFRILEATKFLMFDVAVQLHKAMNCGEDVPIFAMLLFARDSCDTPRSLLINHLNRTGDTGGLEQVSYSPLLHYETLSFGGGGRGWGRQSKNGKGDFHTF